MQLSLSKILSLGFVLITFNASSANAGALDALINDWVNRAVYEVSGGADADFYHYLEVADRMARQGKSWVPENVYMSDQNKEQIRAYSEQQLRHYGFSSQSTRTQAQTSHRSGSATQNQRQESTIQASLNSSARPFREGQWPTLNPPGPIDFIQMGLLQFIQRPELKGPQFPNQALQEFLPVVYVEAFSSAIQSVVSKQWKSPFADTLISPILANFIMEVLPKKWPLLIPNRIDPRDAIETAKALAIWDDLKKAVAISATQQFIMNEISKETTGQPVEQVGLKLLMAGYISFDSVLASLENRGVAKTTIVSIAKEVARLAKSNNRSVPMHFNWLHRQYPSKYRYNEASDSSSSPSVSCKLIPAQDR